MRAVACTTLLGHMEGLFSDVVANFLDCYAGMRASKTETELTGPHWLVLVADSLFGL